MSNNPFRRQLSPSGPMTDRQSALRSRRSVSLAAAGNAFAAADNNILEQTAIPAAAGQEIEVSAELSVLDTSGATNAILVALQVDDGNGTYSTVAQRTVTAVLSTHAAISIKGWKTVAASGYYKTRVVVTPAGICTANDADGDGGSSEALVLQPTLAATP